MSDRRLMLVDSKKNPMQTKTKTKTKNKKQKIKNLTITTSPPPPPKNQMTIYYKAGTDSTNSTV